MAVKPCPLWGGCTRWLASPGRANHVAGLRSQQSKRSNTPKRVSQAAAKLAFLKGMGFTGCGKTQAFEGYGLQPVRKYPKISPALAAEGTVFHSNQHFSAPGLPLEIDLFRAKGQRLPAHFPFVARPPKAYTLVTSSTRIRVRRGRSRGKLLRSHFPGPSLL